MPRLFFVLLSLLVFSSQLPAASFFEKLLFEVEFNNRVLNGKKSPPFKPEIECPQRLRNAQHSWKDNSDKIRNGLILEGEMKSGFTKDEILNMGQRNVHGIVGKVRGTDKVLTDGHSYGGVPVFPHTLPGCEKYFEEEVKILEIAGKSCREIKFSDPKNALAYIQFYCEGSTNIFINASPAVVPVSDCFAGTDLVHCR